MGSDIVSFMSAVATHWVALVGGVIVAALTFYERLRNKLPNWAWYLLIIAFVVTAIFQAWRDEHSAVRNLIAQNGILASENAVLKSGIHVTYKEIQSPNANFPFGIEAIVQSQSTRVPFSLRFITDKQLSLCGLRIINLFQDPREYGPGIPESMNGCDKHVMAGIEPDRPWVISMYATESFKVIALEIIPLPY